LLDVLGRAFDEQQMKQTTYQVVTSDDQNLREDTAFFEHESEARTYARVQAQGGCGAYVLKVETEFLTYYAPEMASERSDQEQTNWKKQIRRSENAHSGSTGVRDRSYTDVPRRARDRPKTERKGSEKSSS
jgi:hypothetical protein